MQQIFDRDAAFDRARAALTGLTTPGVFGYYTHFEVTEVFAVRDEERTPFNVFSILVAEEHDVMAGREPVYLGERIRLRLLKSWMFGIQRCLRPVLEIVQAFEHFQCTEE